MGVVFVRGALNRIVQRTTAVPVAGLVTGSTVGLPGAVLHHRRAGQVWHSVRCSSFFRRPGCRKYDRFLQEVRFLYPPFNGERW